MIPPELIAAAKQDLRRAAIIRKRKAAASEMNRMRKRLALRLMFLPVKRLIEIVEDETARRNVENDPTHARPKP